MRLIPLFALLGFPAEGSNPNEQALTYGRISDDKFILTPDQIACFKNEGCVTIPDVLTESEIRNLETIFEKFMSREIHVPGKDFCDMSKPFGVPMKDWSIVNCMLPTKYYPPLQNNIYERLCKSMATQLYGELEMTKDYDQLLNKLPGKKDAVFAWHQDMGYWPSSNVLRVNVTSTCTFSLAIDHSDEGNGCLRYVVGSGLDKQLRKHVPSEGSRDDGHALKLEVRDDEVVKFAPAKRGSITIHDEYVIHGSGGNPSKHRQRRTYVVAFRPKKVVDGERELGFTHSHNDEVNWDTFDNFIK